MADNDPRRYTLHENLCALLGTRYCYFQPPESLKLQFPCIVYELDKLSTKHADNKPYSLSKFYTITYIYTDPDDSLPEKIAMLPTCSFNRHFVSDGLYHDVFKLYF